MANLPVETVEPDPAATSIANDQTVNKEGGDAAAPTEKAQDKSETASAAEVKSADKKEENGSTDVVMEDKTDDKPKNKDDDTTKKNGAFSERKYHNKYDKQKSQRFHKYRNESKYDASVLPETDDPSAIRAQVEFYFSDSNLPTDEFLWKETGGPENEPVSVSVIAKFGRMKRFKPYSAIVAALKDSVMLNVVGEEGFEKVRRKKPYDPATRLGGRTESRSIYAKGFGDEAPTTQFDIEAFFAPYGPINVVRLRRTDDKLFKGSVFVEFADDELAQKFLELDPKPKWQDKFDLKITSKREYTSGKEQEIKDGTLQPSETRKFNGNKEFLNRGNSRGGYRKGGRGGDRGGDRDPDDWKKRREDDQKSGFKGRKGDHNGRGRGGRGRGGRDRDDRGPRNNDRNNDRNREREQKEKNGDKQDTEMTEAKPAGVKTGSAATDTTANAATEDKTDVGSDSKEKKRPREDEGAEEAPAAKKVDVKAAPTEAS